MRMLSAKRKSVKKNWHSGSVFGKNEIKSREHFYFPPITNALRRQTFASTHSFWASFWSENPTWTHFFTWFPRKWPSAELAGRTKLWRCQLWRCHPYFRSSTSTFSQGNTLKVSIRLDLYFRAWLSYCAFDLRKIFFFVSYLDQICHCRGHGLYWAAEIRHFMASFTLLMDDDESWHLKQMQIQFQLMYAEICSMLQFDEFFNYFLQNSQRIARA